MKSKPVHVQGSVPSSSDSPLGLGMNTGSDGQQFSSVQKIFSLVSVSIFTIYGNNTRTHQGRQHEHQNHFKIQYTNRFGCCSDGEMCCCCETFFVGCVEFT